MGVVRASAAAMLAEMRPLVNSGMVSDALPITYLSSSNSSGGVRGNPVNAKSNAGESSSCVYDPPTATVGQRCARAACASKPAASAWWRAAAQNTRRLRTGKGTTYVSPFYEYNGNWMAWSVTRTAQGYADFRRAWERVAAIWRQEFPGVELVLPAACARDVPAAMMPSAGTYDLIGCTIYNAWPWREDGGPTMRLLEAGRQRALAAGKPFAITEWANSANPRAAGGGGDAPGFISAMDAWMRKNSGTGPGELVFETFFNIDGYALDHMLLRYDGGGGVVSGSQTRTAARYRELWSR